MFVAMSRFTVANGMIEDVAEAFRNRPGLVDSAPGFRRMDVMTSIDPPGEFWLMTYWDDEASFQAWYKSHAFKDSHMGMPKGLKLDPSRTKITYLEHVAS